MVFLPEEKVKIIHLWYETKSCVTVKRRFRQEFGCHSSQVPSNTEIHRFVSHFEKEGSVLKQAKGRSGRTPEVTGDGDRIEQVRQSVSESPRTSTRHRCQELGMARTSLRRVLRKNLRFFPYRIAEAQNLSQQDKERRELMCKWLMEKEDGHRNWSRHIWFTDEAHFHLNGHVNAHNNVYWSERKPEEVTETGRMGARITCLVAFNTRHGLLGPYWFQDEDGNTVTVNQERYRDVLGRLHEDMARTMTETQMRLAWFMQDGAPPHTARETLQLLQELFGHRVISKGSETEWAPHSPDLNPLDFWFWGACKDNVYRNKRSSLEELRLSVEQYVREVSADTAERVGASFLERVQMCLQRKGAHFEHMRK